MRSGNEGGVSLVLLRRGRLLLMVRALTGVVVDEQCTRMKVMRIRPNGGEPPHGHLVLCDEMRLVLA